MGEIGALVALTGVGLLLLAPARRALAPVALGALAFPLGAAAFALGAAVQVAVVERVDPGPLLAGTILVAGVIAAVSARRHRLSQSYLRTVVFTLAIAAALAWIFWAVHLTRLTIDSMRYLLASVDLTLPNGITEVHPPDLVKRQLGLPSWHTLAEFTDRRYVAGLNPLFGASGTVLLGWFVWNRTGLEPRRRRVILTVGAVAFTVTSNRFLYDWFYVNTHVAMAVLVFVAVAGLWICVVDRSPDWAIPAGIALAATLVLRSESPLVVALILIAFANWLPGVRARLWAALPSVIAAVVWHGWILSRHAPGGTEIALDAPVSTGLAAVLIAALVVLLGGSPRTRLAALMERALLPGMAIALAVASVLDLGILLDTLGATALNVGYEGLWMLALTVGIPLGLAAIAVQRIPAGRPWVTFLIGFGLLFLALPFAREAPYRLGAGDSGNRILAHAFLVLVAFLVMAGTRGSAADQEQSVRPGG